MKELLLTISVSILLTNVVSAGSTLIDPANLMDRVTTNLHPLIFEESFKVGDMARFEMSLCTEGECIVSELATAVAEVSSHEAVIVEEGEIEDNYSKEYITKNSYQMAGGNPLLIDLVNQRVALFTKEMVANMKNEDEVEGDVEITLLSFNTTRQGEIELNMSVLFCSEDLCLRPIAFGMILVPNTPFIANISNMWMEASFARIDLTMTEFTRE